MFVAGQIYEVVNFIVAPFNKMYKCFEGDLQIVLLNKTKVTKVEEYQGFIPENVFNFTSLEKIVEAEKDFPHLIGKKFTINMFLNSIVTFFIV